MLKLSAKEFTKRLMELQSDDELRKIRRYFPNETPDDRFVGIRMGEIFKLGKEFSEMPVDEIEKLMESPIHEMRAGAMSIMGQCAKGKKCSEERLGELYELYIRRHDRINNWDLVDLAAYYVVGKYLADKPRDILYKLAQSNNMWERRTAILATAHFILKLKQTDDTFAIAEMLVNDNEDLVNKGTGWMLRTAGGVDPQRLTEFLDRHSLQASRILVRYATENLDAATRAKYVKARRAL